MTRNSTGPVALAATSRPTSMLRSAMMPSKGATTLRKLFSSAYRAASAAASFTAALHSASAASRDSISSGDTAPSSRMLCARVALPCAMRSFARAFSSVAFA